MSVKNLAEVDADELRKFLDSFDEVLCDCDGEYDYDHGQYINLDYCFHLTEH